jgi:outer membrane protein assembly factor BamB
MQVDRVLRRTVVATVVGGLLALSGVGSALVPPAPIPQGDSSGIDKFVGSEATADPVKSFRVPRHPFMAPNGRSNIHSDAYMTDTHAPEGVLGRNIETTSAFEVAECASVAFDTAGRIITICVGIERPRLMMLDPVTLETLAEFPLPPRMGGGTGTSPFNDFSGGGYFYLDHQDRVVTPTNNREIWVLDSGPTPLGMGFEIDRRYDLTSVVPPGEAIVSVLPDWDGLLWFVTTRGKVGTVDPASGQVRALTLDGETISNSFATDETGGVFVVSDHALYRFDSTNVGAPGITWRQVYDRGDRMKPGQVSIGSGTTPTLIGKRYVSITDNADPRMHVVVYERGKDVDDRLVCEEPVFEPGEGATDNSLIAVGRSLIVENNYGYSGLMAVEGGASTTPGVTRVSFNERQGCTTVWESDEISPSVVPKVSLGAGLVYLYTKEPRDDDKDAWYLTALNYRTGETVFKRFSGEGLGYNNNYAPITVGPDGAVYVGVLGGLVRFEDAY